MKRNRRLPEGFVGSGRSWWVVAASAGAVAVYGTLYLLLGARMYPNELADSFRARPWGIYTHAGFGALGLMTGALQLRRSLLDRSAMRHRLLGKVYLAAAAMVGLSGIYMALYSFGGATTHIGFGFMGAALLGTTAVAYRRIRAFAFAEHREWMIRSFALMFGAVTFRLWLPILVVIYRGDFALAYPWVAWLCWVPNLVVAEAYIRWTRKRAGGRSADAALSEGSLRASLP